MQSLYDKPRKLIQILCWWIDCYNQVRMGKEEKEAVIKAEAKDTYYMDSLVKFNVSREKAEKTGNYYK